MISLVCKKLCKNKDPLTISEELEEEFSIIDSICQAAGPFAPEYDIDKIYETLFK